MPRHNRTPMFLDIEWRLPSPAEETKAFHWGRLPMEMVRMIILFMDRDTAFRAAATNAQLAWLLYDTMDGPCELRAFDWSRRGHRYTSSMWHLTRISIDIIQLHPKGASISCSRKCMSDMVVKCNIYDPRKTKRSEAIERVQKYYKDPNATPYSTIDIFVGITEEQYESAIHVCSILPDRIARKYRANMSKWRKAHIQQDCLICDAPDNSAKHYSEKHPETILDTGYLRDPETGEHFDSKEDLIIELRKRRKCDGTPRKVSVKRKKNATRKGKRRKTGYYRDYTPTDADEEEEDPTWEDTSEVYESETFRCGFCSAECKDVNALFSHVSNHHRWALDRCGHYFSYFTKATTPPDGRMHIKNASRGFLRKSDPIHERFK